MITEAQKLGLKSFFVDMESAMNLDYAKGLGIQLEDIVWSQPSSTEEALGAIEDAIRSGIFGLIILDSVAALVSLKELEDDLGSANVALTARALSNFLRRNKSNILKNNVALVFTNQLRDKIGGYMGGTTTPGGRAIKFYDEVEMSIRRVQDIKDAKEIIGHTAEISIKKNKVAVPFKSAQFDIIYGKGIDPYRDMIEVAKNLGVLTLKGSYYVYIDESLGQGKDNAAETVKNNPSMMEEIRKECFERINS
jgi:recombination protein RecA